MKSRLSRLGACIVLLLGGGHDTPVARDDAGPSADAGIPAAAQRAEHGDRDEPNAASAGSGATSAPFAITSTSASDASCMP